MTFNPHAIENHYGLDLCAFLLHRAQPSSVRVCSPDVDVVLACARRLLWTQILVENTTIAAQVEQRLAVAVKVADTQESDAVLLPFSRQYYAQPPRASLLVVINSNRLSYKGLISPVRDHVFALLRWLRADCQVTDRWGLFPPRFVAQWIISLVAGARYPALHFQLGQQAMDELIVQGGLWWLSYLNVIEARPR